MKTDTTKQQKEEAAKGLLDLLAGYQTLNCYAAVQDVVRFAEVIYKTAFEHGQEFANDSR